MTFKFQPMFGMHHRVLLFFAFVLVVSPVQSETDSLKAFMQKHYEEFRLGQSNGGDILPFQLESAIEKDYSFASIRYFLDDISFDTFATQLIQPAEWCEFIPLHLNIKACTYLKIKGRDYLRFYVGTKGYVSPDNAHVLQLSFDAKSEDGVFTVKLFAADGPFDSADINFSFRAIEVQDESKSKRGIYLEFDLSSVPGLVANLAKVYLVTIARKKIGFSRAGNTWTGKPKYVGGTRGAAERNIVRYMLSIETYLSTLDLPKEARFIKRLETWFDSTELYKAQLYELGRSEYLANKKRERKNQELLQMAVGSNITPEFHRLDRGN